MGMPNWCDNRLAIRGAPGEVMDLVALLEGEEPLDFERLLPMPEAIRDGGDYEAHRGRDGFPGWYQWSCEHWGVKWNASYSSRRGYGRTGRVRYRFLTPYDPPMEFMHELAASFPGLEFDLVFDIEMWGQGRAEWRDGELTELVDVA
jgi:Ferredoxin-like domain in Api92-like protein